MEANGNTTQATAALYLRTSNIDERAGDNRSITDQRHDLERLAEFVGESRRPAASVASQLSSSDRYIRLSDSSQYAARKLLRAPKRGWRAQPHWRPVVRLVQMAWARAWSVSARSTYPTACTDSSPVSDIMWSTKAATAGSLAASSAFT